MRVLLLFSLVTSMSATFAQTTSQTPAPSEALRILEAVGQKYAEAKSYQFEATEEETSTNELERDWRKTIMSVTVGTNGRYRYEAHSAYGAALIVSDGKTIWTYHYHEHLYTQKPVESDSPSGRPRLIDTEEEGIENAKHLWRTLPHISDWLNSARLLPDETIALNGVPRHCIVIHYGPSDLKEGTQQAKVKEQATIWIDKEEKVIVKVLRKDDSYVLIPVSGAHVPLQTETTIIFPFVKLNAPAPDEVFLFSPPTDATLVDEFPGKKKFQQRRASAEKAAADLLGKNAPEVELKSDNGKVLRLSSLRGRPVVIDVWATWCEACVAMLPELKKLKADLTAAGVTFLSVDLDDKASTATAFLAGEHADWQNYHDADGALQTAFHSSGIPWQLLLDKDGTVVFFRAGEDIAKLRAAVAGLGPQYATVGAAPVEEPR